MRLTPIQVRDFIERLAEHAIETGISNVELGKAVRKRYVEIALDLDGGNQCKVARRLRVHRNTLSRWLRELGIELARSRRGRPALTVGEKKGLVA